MSNITFLEIRPLSDSEISQQDKEQALDVSFKFLFEAFMNGRQVNSLYCTRELLRSFREKTGGHTEETQDIKFYEQIKTALKAQVFDPRILFNSIFEFQLGTQERLLLKESLLRNLSIFGDETVSQNLKEEFEIADIIFITPEYRGIAMAGGIATMLTDLCECFQSMGLQISIIIPYYRFNK